MNHLLLQVVAYLGLILIAFLMIRDLISTPKFQQVFIFRTIYAITYLIACFLATLFPCVWWTWKHSHTFAELLCLWAIVTGVHLFVTWLLAHLFERRAVWPRNKDMARGISPRFVFIIQHINSLNKKRTTPFIV